MDRMTIVDITDAQWEKLAYALSETDHEAALAFELLFKCPAPRGLTKALEVEAGLRTCRKCKLWHFGDALWCEACDPESY